MTLLVGWVVSTVLMRFGKQPGLLRPALLLGGLVVTQPVPQALDHTL